MILSKKYVFTYHNVSNNISFGLNDIKIKKFLSHISFYNDINKNNIEICFDDGYQDVFNNTFKLLSNNNIKKIIRSKRYVFLFFENRLTIVMTKAKISNGRLWKK